MRGFDPALHVSPFWLFRRLWDARDGKGEAPRLLDVRGEAAATAPGLEGARPFSEQELPTAGGTENEPVDTVLIDDDGHRATELVHRLRGRGHHTVRALYGGLVLYDFALDPTVVGEERFLQKTSGPRGAA